MPVLKFSRDKRGYEHFFLVHPSGPRSGDGRPVTRLLYWFRTPPNVKVGREPFDVEARRRLERQHPGLRFDWDALISTPIPPPPEAELWRERRRAERAAKQAAREAVTAERETPRVADDPAAPDVSLDSRRGPEAASVDEGVSRAESEGAAPGQAAARRRRRRRRRGRGGPAAAAEAAGSEG